jgi:hypothetical protein
MTPEERLEMDLRGYFVRRGALAPDVPQMRAAVEGCVPDPSTGKFLFVGRDRRFVALAADPRIADLGQDLCGPHFRCDHAFGMRLAPGSGISSALHGGPRAEQGHFTYEVGRDGQIWCGSVKVLIALSEVREGDGGFVALPGSHKLEVPLALRADYLTSPLLVNPALGPGDVLCFTEAVVHGTRPWRGRDDRLALFYTYMPGWAAWRQHEHPWDVSDGYLTEAESRVWAPPWTGIADQDAAGVWRHAWRGRTLEP